MGEEATHHHCHASAQELIECIEQFRQGINANPYEVADCLWVKDYLDFEVEKLRISLPPLINPKSSAPPEKRWRSLLQTFFEKSVKAAGWSALFHDNQRSPHAHFLVSRNAAEKR